MIHPRKKKIISTAPPQNDRLTVAEVKESMRSCTADEIARVIQHLRRKGLIRWEKKE